VRQNAIKIVAGVVILAALALLFQFLPVGTWLREFQAWVRGLGALGYVLYVIVYAICVVALIPASLLTVGAGAIFGAIPGTIVNVCGATIGAMLAFLLARTVLRHRVEKMLERKPKLAAVDRALAREGTKLLVLCRLSGFPPFTWANYAFGATAVRPMPYFLATFFGIIPGTFAYTYAGAAGAAVASGHGNRIGLIVTAVGIVLVAGYVAHIATTAIRRAGA
jgi:uncharacterized membrane protein YdjX (TVP38/TMEM64 family)